ncbi:MAG: hypothetical protein ABL998_19920, partial [Planctomycetota bacterium]
YEAVEDSRQRLGRELENKHATELSQVADHAQRQIARLEDDIKKKKRGLSELTQRNIQLQNEINTLKAEVAASNENPPAVRPRAGGQPLSALMTMDGDTPASSQKPASEESALQPAPRKSDDDASRA